MPEIFKTIPWLDLLVVSNQWYVIRKEYYKKNHSKSILMPEIILTNTVWKTWYKYISYVWKRYLLSRVIAAAFLWLDINDSKMFVCHKDDNPSNNSVDNLFLWTHMDNMQDRNNKWRMAVNEMLPHTKLNSDMINFIRDSKWKMKQTKLWKMFNVNPCHISRIQNNLRRNYA